MLYIDKKGIIDAERIITKIFSNIERGNINSVNGIVVHQTEGSSAESAFK